MHLRQAKCRDNEVSDQNRRIAALKYLAGNASWDDNNLDSFESLVELVCGVAYDLQSELSRERQNQS